MSKKKTNNSLESEIDLISLKTEKVKLDQLKKEEDKKFNYIVNQNLIKEVIEKTVPLFKTSQKAPVKFKAAKMSEEKTLCITMSDIHIGKKITGYGYEEFKEKLKNLYFAVKDLILEKKPSKLIIFLIGDVCDGDSIYPGHSNFICMNVAEQSIQGAKDLSDYVYNLSLLVSEIEIVCVGGNHGRPGKKGEHTLRDNWDYVLYQIMKVHLKSVSNVVFNISDDWKVFVKIGSLTFMAFHGDETVQGNPLANLPKAVVSWGDMWQRKGIQFDAAVCGHFHKPIMGIQINGRELFVNGSFSPGLNEDYSEKKIREINTTSQISWIVQGNRILDRNLLVI